MREVLPRISRKAARARAHGLDQQCDGRTRQKRDHGQLPVEHQHEADDADQSQQIREGVQRPGGKQLEDRVCVIGDARDQSAHWGAIEEAERQLVQELEQRSPQVTHGASPGDLHGIDLEERQHSLGDDQQRQIQAAGAELAHVARERALIQQHAHEQGLQERGRGREHPHEQGHIDHAAVGPHIRP